MILVVSLIAASIALYYALGYGSVSIFKKPSIAQLTFFRDYLILTMLAYLYYLTNESYKSHYILKALPDVESIRLAAVFAMIFIFTFLICYKLMYRGFSDRIGRIRIVVYPRKISFLLSVISPIFLLYFVLITLAYDASIVGILKFNLEELNLRRTQLAQGGGFLSFNKVIIKQWIPMLAYMWYYVYLTEKKLPLGQRVLFYCTVAMSLLASVWYFEKSIIAFHLLGFVGTYVFAGRTLKKKVVLAAIGASILLVSSMYIAIYQSKIVDSKYLFNILVHRATSQCVGSIMAIDYYSMNTPEGYAGVSNLWASAVGERFQSPYSKIIDHYIPETQEISGSLSSFVTGEAFGLFGLFGVVFSGIIIAIYYAFFEASKHSEFTAYLIVPLYAVIFSHFYVASSFYSFMWPVGFVYALFPFALITLLSSKYHI